jgi:hypothetical protein
VTCAFVDVKKVLDEELSQDNIKERLGIQEEDIDWLLEREE